MAKRQRARSSATAEAVRDIESIVVDESERGKHVWPIPVQAFGTTAYLRLEKGKRRILIDWVVPDAYRSASGTPRIKMQIPRDPERTGEADPGHNPTLAKQWAERWLKDRVVAGEAGGGDVRNGRTVENSVILERLAEHWYAALGPVSDETRAQYRKWLDFMIQVTPGGRFPLNRLDVTTPRGIVNDYMRPWARIRPDGSACVESGAGWNTAVRVADLLRRMCAWGTAKSIGPGRYLLDSDPYARVQPRDVPAFRKSDASARGVASDAYADRLIEVAREVTPSGQCAAILTIQRLTGRRIAECRLLRRCDFMTEAHEIEQALHAMRCREAFPEKFITEEEIAQAAHDYAELGGAIYFRMENVKQVNQARSRADEKVDLRQFDVVVPVARRLADQLNAYIEDHWAKLGLVHEAPLFPAQRKGLRVPSPKATVGDWLADARARVALADPHLRLPQGTSHPLRARMRYVLHQHGIDRETVAVYLAWALNESRVMDRVYLPIRPHDLIKAARVIDEHA
jgi:integrase